MFDPNSLSLSLKNTHVHTPYTHAHKIQEKLWLENRGGIWKLSAPFFYILKTYNAMQQKSRWEKEGEEQKKWEAQERTGNWIWSKHIICLYENVIMNPLLCIICFKSNILNNLKSNKEQKTICFKKNISITKSSRYTYSF